MWPLETKKYEDFSDLGELDNVTAWNSALAAEVLNFSTFVSFTMRWSYCQRGLLPQAIMQIFREKLCGIC